MSNFVCNVQHANALPLQEKLISNKAIMQDMASSPRYHYRHSGPAEIEIAAGYTVRLEGGDDGEKVLYRHGATCELEATPPEMVIRHVKEAWGSKSVTMSIGSNVSFLYALHMSDGRSFQFSERFRYEPESDGGEVK